MAATTTNMKLTKWNLANDTFNYNQLAANFEAIDTHDHSANKGVPIPTGGIADTAITNAKLASLSVNTGNIVGGAVTNDKVDNTVSAAWLAANGTLSNSPVDNQRLWVGPSTDAYRSQILGYNATYSSATATYYPYDWFFRYSAARVQWAFTGGSPLFAMNANQFALTTSNALIDNTTVKVPFKGLYMFEYSGEWYNGSSSTPTLSVQLRSSTGNPAMADFAHESLIVGGGGSRKGTFASKKIVSVASGGTTYSIQATTTDTTGTPYLQDTCLSVTPIYITA